MKTIAVYADWEGMPAPTCVGQLSATPARGREVFSFAYDPGWLGGGLGQSLDPALLLYAGPQYPPAPKENFGLFLDSSPDRWGRFLMQRREAQAARREGRKARQLLESDYLLGVHDSHRMGALRFRTAPDGAFLDDTAAYAAPPWTSLRELEEASRQIEKPGAEKSTDYEKWIRMLIAPGGSLGGARPKAGVRDVAGHPWIAKFPSRNDTSDIGTWEFLVHGLAIKAGIAVSEAQVKKFSSEYGTFLTRRFDRTDTGERTHFASAMTLLNRADGDDHTAGVSYLELADFLQQSGAQPEADLKQLWRRIVFFMCVSNVDDHLRNHGFLLEPGSGWRLSPAYDMNPVPFAEGLKLNVSESDNSQDLQLALEVATFFRLKPREAKETVAEVVAAVKTWRTAANALGISHREQEGMEPAFRVADTE